VTSANERFVIKSSLKHENYHLKTEQIQILNFQNKIECCWPGGCDL